MSGVCRTNSKLNIMWRKVILVGMLVICSALSWAETGRFRLLIRQDPGSSITIGWDQISGQPGTVYYGTVDFASAFQKYPYSKAPDRVVAYKGMKNCFVRLTDLEPNTAYFFVVKDQSSISERYWFKTTPDQRLSRLSVVAGGDSRNHRAVRRNANKMVAKLRPHFVLFGGDMTRNGTDDQWKAWFDDWQLTITSDNKLTPVAVARGNHERSNEIIVNLFDTPGEDVYYGFNVAGGLARIYTLNTEISVKGAQTHWLKSDLSAHHDVRWKIMQYHKPMRPHVLRKYEGYEVYEAWAGLIYEHKVQLVVECDAHTVKRTWPIRPDKTHWKSEGFVRDDTNGTVYVGEGCWGAPTRPASDPKPWTRAHGEFNQFKWIFIDDEKIELRTVRVDYAEEVVPLREGQQFDMPTGIRLWEPKTGELILIR